MKKVQKTLTALVLAAVTIVSLNSCKKETNTPPALGTATISGKVTAEQDVNNTVTEAAAGVTIQVTVSAYDQSLNPNGGYNYPTKVYSAVTDANGMYTVVVEVGNQQLTAYGTVQDITYDVVNTTGSTPATTRTVFGGETFSRDLNAGSTAIVDIIL